MDKQHIYTNSAESDDLTRLYKEAHHVQSINGDVINYLISLGLSPISIVGSLRRVLKMKAREVKKTIFEISSSENLKREIIQAEDNFIQYFLEDYHDD
ncbi:hypothetical protein MF271_22735 (plasmid) [Deinococcus sp. KNUC1210]|uniref:hypothetical protein n=1 Tax=Deinococcus sp. KNUC1210 TaxID=2917691 RepID=UPI001EF09CF4|nr:hypothetical protein [Deinococcus sp. KNUC1210]ULH18283.1 hypothetical protein MF271_22735 [Deinococcus sp. KNUC1210]